MILFDDFWGVHVVDWFPGVITRWVTLPLDKVLEGLASSKESVIDNRFHFKLLIPLHEVRGRSSEVGTV